MTGVNLSAGAMLDRTVGGPCVIVLAAKFKFVRGAGKITSVGFGQRLAKLLAIG